MPSNSGLVRLPDRNGLQRFHAESHCGDQLCEGRSFHSRAFAPQPSYQSARPSPVRTESLVTAIAGLTWRA